MRLRMLVLALAVGCGGGFKPEQYPTPESLWAAAKAAYDRGDCRGASRGFSRLLFEYPPRDPRAAEPRFLLGECHLKDGDNLLAVQEFRRVADDFPSHELAPRALLRAADAQAGLWRRAELDPTYGEQALATYAEVATRFPGSDAATQARERSAKLTDRFALKDIKNGDFYFRLHAYDAAIIYYRSVVVNAAESSYAPVALLRLVETYRRIGYVEEVAETCEHLRRFYATFDGVQDACPAPPSAP